MLKKRELVFKTRRLSNYGNLYLPPFDWQQPKFFQSLKVPSDWRPKTRTSAFSTLKDRPTQIWLIDMYLLHVNNDQVFSTQSKFYNPRVCLMSIPPATLQVTSEHSIFNQIIISFDYIYLIMTPTTVFLQDCLVTPRHYLLLNTCLPAFITWLNLPMR